jgi:hypothetical protein
MPEQNLTHSLVVDQSPADVYAAINNVRLWWSLDITGPTDTLGGVFEFRYKDMHLTTQRISELVPDRKVVWHVLDSQLNFVADKTEWTGTDIVFEINPRGGKTELVFTHIGLHPGVECYEQCNKGWAFYVGESLRDLITTGKGQPAARQRVAQSAARAAQ